MAYRNAVRVVAAVLVSLSLSACNKSQPTTPQSTATPAQAPASPAAAPSTTTQPDAAPNTTIALANREKVNGLLQAARGKVLVINVWATYCVPCIEEMPELAAFYKGRDPQRIEFLSLSADGAYALEDAVKPFAAEKQLPFPVYVLDELPPDELVKLIGAGASGWDGELPATFVFDATGALKKYWLERVHLNDLSASVSGAMPG